MAWAEGVERGLSVFGYLSKVKPMKFADRLEVEQERR